MQSTNAWPQLHQSHVDGVDDLAPFPCPSGRESNSGQLPVNRPRVGWVSSASSSAKHTSETHFEGALLARLGTPIELTAFQHEYNARGLGAQHRPDVLSADVPPMITHHTDFVIKELNAVSFLFDKLYRHRFECIMFDVTAIESVCANTASVELKAEIASLHLLVVPSVLYFNTTQYNHTQWSDGE